MFNLRCSRNKRRPQAPQPWAQATLLSLIWMCSRSLITQGSCSEWRTLLLKARTHREQEDRMWDSTTRCTTRTTRHSITRATSTTTAFISMGSREGPPRAQPCSMQSTFPARTRTSFWRMTIKSKKVEYWEQRAHLPFRRHLRSKTTRSSQWRGPLSRWRSLWKSPPKNTLVSMEMRIQEEQEGLSRMWKLTTWWAIILPDRRLTQWGCTDCSRKLQMALWITSVTLGIPEEII